MGVAWEVVVIGRVAAATYQFAVAEAFVAGEGPRLLPEAGVSKR